MLQNHFTVNRKKKSNKPKISTPKNSTPNSFLVNYLDFYLHYKILHNVSTVKTRFTDTRLTQTPNYYMDSLLAPWGKKALTFSLNSARLIRTPH